MKDWWCQDNYFVARNPISFYWLPSPVISPISEYTPTLPWHTSRSLSVSDVSDRPGAPNECSCNMPAGGTSNRKIRWHYLFLSYDSWFEISLLGTPPRFFSDTFSTRVVETPHTSSIPRSVSSTQVLRFCLKGWTDQGMRNANG